MVYPRRLVGDICSFNVDKSIKTFLEIVRAFVVQEPPSFSFRVAQSGISCVYLRPHLISVSGGNNLKFVFLQDQEVSDAILCGGFPCRSGRVRITNDCSSGETVLYFCGEQLRVSVGYGYDGDYVPFPSNDGATDSYRRVDIEITAYMYR